MRAGSPWNCTRSLRELDPAPQMRVRPGTARARPASVTRDVLRIARERDPAERPLALAEERPDVRRARSPGMSNASSTPASCATCRGGCCRSRRRRAPARCSASIAAHVRGHRVARARFDVLARDRASRSSAGVLERHAGGHVAVAADRARDVWSVTRSGTTPRRDELRQDLGGVADEADRERAAARARAPRSARERVVEIARLLVEVARLEARARCASGRPRRRGTTPPFIVAASGCAPPMPPSPPVSDEPAARACRRSAARAAAANVSYVPCRMPCVPM